MQGFFHETFTYSLCLHKIAQISYSCQSLPTSAITPPSLVISPLALLGPSFMRVMADVYILEKLNVGEVGDGDEEIKGVSHGNACWKRHSFR